MRKRRIWVIIAGIVLINLNFGVEIKASEKSNIESLNFFEEDGKIEIKDSIEKEERVVMYGDNLNLKVGDIWSEKLHKMYAISLDDSINNIHTDEAKSKYDIVAYRENDIMPIEKSIDTGIDKNRKIIKKGEYNVFFVVVKKGETPLIEYNDKDEIIKTNIIDTIVMTVSVHEKDEKPNEEKLEVIKTSGKDIVLNVGDEWKSSLHEARAWDINNDKKEYEIRPTIYLDTENPIISGVEITDISPNMLDITGLARIPGKYNIVFIVLEKGDNPLNPDNIKAEFIQSLQIEGEGGKPVIIGNDIKLNVGDKFDTSLLDIRAIDEKDGDITDKIKYNGQVNTAKEGKYYIDASVEDSDKNSVSKTFVVEVIKRNPAQDQGGNIQSKPLSDKPDTGDSSQTGIIMAGLTSLGLLSILRKK